MATVTERDLRIKMQSHTHQTIFSVLPVKLVVNEVYS